MQNEEIQKLLAGKPGHVVIERVSNHYQRSKNGAWMSAPGQDRDVHVVPEEKAIDWVGGEVSYIYFADGQQEHWALCHTPCRFFTTDPSGEPRLFKKGYYRPVVMDFTFCKMGDSVRVEAQSSEGLSWWVRHGHVDNWVLAEGAPALRAEIEALGFTIKEV